MSFRMPVKMISEVKPLQPIGACLDIPTGYWVKGRHGEWILIGGLGPLTAVIGPGKMYKSTLLHYMLLSAMNRIRIGKVDTSATTYDSETNIHLNRLRAFAASMSHLKDEHVLDTGIWTVSDAADYLGDKWYAIVRTYMRDKIKAKKDLMVELPVVDKDGKLIQCMMPTFSEVDSFTAMSLSAGDEIMKKNDIGDAGGSHLYVKEGLGKSQMLHEIPYLSAASNHFFLLTAHIGNNNGMQSSGPGKAPPKKDLQFLSTDIKIKGVTTNFLYLLHNLWNVVGCSLLWNKDDKTTLYPTRPGKAIVGDTDLNEITVQHVRGNAGANGFKLKIVVSQSEGVLSEMTEFRNLKENGFGFQGNDRNYQTVLCPNITVNRNTVREKIATEPAFARSLNVLSELLQMHMYQRNLGDELMSAEELMAGLIKQGYDVEWLLLNTRGWWTYNNDTVDKYYLSTRDWLDIARGTKVPYWMEDDRKTVKKEYLR